jgi:hypothetical protein
MSTQDSDSLKASIIESFFSSMTYPKVSAVDDLVQSSLFEYDHEWEANFLKSVQFNFAHHYKNCRYFRSICELKNFDLRSLNKFEDIFNIPFILTDTFKTYQIETESPHHPRVQLTSSGTLGRVSKVSLDSISGMRVLYLTYMLYRQLGIAHSEPANYLMMSYNLSKAGDVGTSNADFVVSKLTPLKGIFYALDRNSEGRMEFFLEECIQVLEQYLKEGLPIRILGFPHHTCELIKNFVARHGKINFPENSFILTGGGWKSFANHYPDDFNPWDFVHSNTNLPTSNLRDAYGLIEHAVQYVECEHNHKHVPKVCLACTRDPNTLERLALGQEGILHLITPIFESYPGISVLTTDYGIVKENCECGRAGRYLEILGRAGIKRFPTCAISASELIANSRDNQAP